MQIVVVGNAALNEDFSALIDGADEVIRFNRANNFGGHGGTRTTVLCIANWGEIGRKIAKRQLLVGLPCFPLVREFWFSRPSFRESAFLWRKSWRRDIDSLDYSRAIVRRNSLSARTRIFFGADIYGVLNCVESNAIPRSRRCSPVPVSSGCNMCCSVMALVTPV